jgi:asparagine synthase (glutamine-hydrolysing)
MPTLAGWLTGQQVPHEIIEQTLSRMSEVLGRHGGEKLQTISPGAGLVSFADPAYTTSYEPAVLDWSPERHTLTYHRPISGLHPLYYILDWPDQGNLLFASEIKALFAAGVPRKWHLAALDMLLHQGFIPAPWTAFKDIQVVPAGATLRRQYAQTLLNQVDSYTVEPQHPDTDQTDEFMHTLQQAVQQQLPSDQQYHLAALTSGTIPSLLPIILASQASDRPFTVAMISQRKSSRAKVWRNAETVASTYDKPFLAITAMTGPEYWISTLVETETPAVDMRPCVTHQLLHTLSQETGARIALTALGVRTLLGSSTDSMQTASFNSSSQEQNDPLHLYQATINAYENSARSPWSKDVQTLLSQQSPWSETLHARRLQRRANQFSTPQQAMRYLDLHLRLPDLLVQPFQHIAVQEQIAVRSPYLHPHVTALMLQIATQTDTSQQKDALWSSLLQRIFSHPLQPSEPAPLTLPPAPISHESPLIQQLFSEEQIRSTGLFDPRIIRTLFDTVQNESTNRLFLFVLTTQALAQLFGVSL